MSGIQRLPTEIYVPMLIFSIIMLVVTLIKDNRNYPIPYKVAFILIIFSAILMIILRIEWFNEIRQLLTWLMLISSILGFLTLFISIYINNKRNGIKIDRTVKRVVFACIIIAIFCLIIFVFALYMKNR